MYVRSRSGSLWDTVTSQCTLVELTEVKRIIGESLIEQTCELHTEATSLREILGEDSSRDDPTVTRATVHHVIQLVNELVKQMKSNKLSETSKVTKEMRQALHLESTRLRSQITLLQQELDQRVDDATIPRVHTPDSRPSSSYSSRLNSAQRFRQMITDSRNVDHES